jgi:hypothetical protein
LPHKTSSRSAPDCRIWPKVIFLSDTMCPFLPRIAVSRNMAVGIDRAAGSDAVSPKAPVRSAHRCGSLLLVLAIVPNAYHPACAAGRRRQKRTSAGR